LQSLDKQSEDALELVQIAEERVATLTQAAESLQQEVGRLQNLGRESEGALKTLREDVCQRDLRINEQTSRITRLQSQVQTLLTREQDLRDMLLEAHDQLLRRDEEIAVTLASALPQEVGSSVPALETVRPGGAKYLPYQQLLQKIRDLVRS